MTVTTAGELLEAALAAGASRPLVTFYDDATGERIELSAATFANWVAKTAGLLDEVGVARSDRVALRLPTHWQSTVFLVACWSIGAVPIVGDDAGGCAAAVASPEHLADAIRLDAPVTIGASLDAFGRPLDGAPEGVVDYADEVARQPDELVVPDPPAADDEALDGVSSAELVTVAVERANAWGLTAGGRMLTDAQPVDLEGVLACAAAPLAVGGSVVLSRNLDARQVQRRAEVERITCRVLRDRR